MRRVALVLVLVAACSHEGGLLIDVVPTDPSVDQVRLYVGTGDVTNANLGLPFGPAAANPPIPFPFDNVTYWTRDPENELDTREVGPGDIVRFVLVRTDTDNIPAILAVGYSGGKIVQVATQFDVQVPEKRYALFTLKLEAPVDNLANVATFTAGAWDPASQTPIPEAACVGVFERGARYPRSFIVSPNDQDCDGFANDNPAECTPDIYLGTRDPTLDEVNCLYRDEINSACALGGPLCKDNTDRDQTQCMPSAYCAPVSVCDACTSLACAKDVSTAQPAPAMYRCQVHTMGSTVCGNDIVLDNLPSAGLSCADVEIADKLHKFSNKLDLGSLEIGAEINDTCKLVLKPSGTLPNAANLTLGAMVAVTFKNSRGLAVPVVLAFDSPGSGGGCVSGGAAVHCMPDSALLQTDLTKCVTSGIGPTPVNLPIGAREPTLTGDMLEIWYTTPGGHVFHATRADASVGWGTPVEDSTLEIGSATLAQGATPHVSRDGLTMYLSSDRGAGTGSDIFRTTRLGRLMMPWVLPIPVQGLASADSEGGFSTEPGEHVGIFHRKEGPSLFYTLRSAVGSNGIWSTVNSVSGLQTQGDLLNPFMTDNGLTVYYANNANGKFDLFVANRPTMSAGFAAPQLVPGMSSVKDDVDPWVSPPSVMPPIIYFASDRTGNFQIYMAHL